MEQLSRRLARDTSAGRARLGGGEGEEKQADGGESGQQPDPIDHALAEKYGAGRGGSDDVAAGGRIKSTPAPAEGEEHRRHEAAEEQDSDRAQFAQERE